MSLRVVGTVAGCCMLTVVDGMHACDRGVVGIVAGCCMLTVVDGMHACGRGVWIEKVRMDCNWCCLFLVSQDLSLQLIALDPSTFHFNITLMSSIINLLAVC